MFYWLNGLHRMQDIKCLHATLVNSSCWVVDKKTMVLLTSRSVYKNTSSQHSNGWGRSRNLTVDAESAAFLEVGHKQCPAEMLTTAPFPLSSILGSARRVTRVAATIFLLIVAHATDSVRSIKPWEGSRDPSRLLTMNPISLPLMASLMGLQAEGPWLKSASIKMASTP